MRRALFGLACAITASVTSSAFAVEIVNLRSGWVSGSPGAYPQFEDDITCWAGPGGTALSGSAFTAADFNAAATGPLSRVISSASLPWIATLPADPQARWINSAAYSNGWGSPASVLYAVPFTVTTSSITSATLTVHWAADDTLGGLLAGSDPNQMGVYINGVATTIAGGNFASQTSAINVNVTGLVNTGANTMYFYQRDIGVGVAGLIFSATYTILPTPGTAGLLACGGLAAVSRRRRR